MTHSMWQRALPVAVGVLLVLAGLSLVFASEHAAAAWHAATSRAGRNVHVLEPGAKVSGRNGQLVLLSATPTVRELPQDRDFGVSFGTTRLVRQVSMFQWHEVRVGNKVAYDQDWLDHAVDSSRFRHPAGHANTQSFPFSSRSFLAPRVRLGHFTLAPAIVRDLPTPVEAVTPDFRHLPANLQASFQVHDGALTTTVRAGHPRLGDLRVRWLAAPLATVTVVARVDHERLVPAPRALGGDGVQVTLGQQALTDVFADLPLRPGAIWTWRALALVLAWLGAWLIVRRRRPGSGGVAIAIALSFALLGALAGGVWIAASVLAGVVAWLVAAAGAYTGWLAWRRTA